LKRYFRAMFLRDLHDFGIISRDNNAIKNLCMACRLDRICNHWNPAKRLDILTRNSLTSSAGWNDCDDTQGDNTALTVSMTRCTSSSLNPAYKGMLRQRW